MCSINSFHTDTNDAAILTTNAEIPVGASSVCVYVVAFDDSIAEFNESVLIVPRPDNPLDVINQVTTLFITDINGLCSIISCVIEEPSIKVIPFT